ncbi:MAG: cupredoxin domain-containing protein [Solirubrobacteraceae bacterium]
MSTAGTSAVVSGKTADLKIANYAYQPAVLTVRAGTKVTVTNSDQTAHTVTARSGAFDSGTVNAGKSQRFTATKPGVYQYYCQFHAFMSGTIKVIK